MNDCKRAHEEEGKAQEQLEEGDQKGINNARNEAGKVAAPG